MIQSLFAHYRQYSLRELAIRFSKDYYTTMEELSGKARAFARKGANGAVAENMPNLQRCNKVIEDVKRYMQYRKEVLYPYLEELAAKKREGHDCSHCPGGCKVKHKAKILEINESHKFIRRTLEEINELFPEAEKVPVAEEFRPLRNDMLLMENTLTEIYYLEEEVLLPKIKEAQKKINADGQQ